MTDNPSISARTIEALTAIATGLHDIADAVRETGRAGEGQIATQEPAGATQGGSGDSRASGGLGERLRAAADYQDRPGAHDELRAMADEADRLERERDGARIKGEQWKARYEETRDANRRVLGVAQWLRGQGLVGYARKVEEAVGGMEGALNADHPLGMVIGVIREFGTELYKTEEAPTENPFRMPEDRWPFQRGAVLEWPEDPQTVIDALEDAPVGVHVSDRFGNPWRRFPKGWAAPKSTSDGSNAPSSYLAGRAPITVTALADTEITP